MVEKVIEKLIRQQVDITEMYFDFISGHGNTDTIFIFIRRNTYPERRICTLYLYFWRKLFNELFGILFGQFLGNQV